MMFFKIITTYIFYIFFFSNVLSEEMIFEDFSELKSIENWEFISDQVMGGVSLGRFEVLKEKSINFLRMTGNVSLENNGGFIQVRKKVYQSIEGNIKRIKLTTRGNRSDYFIHLRTRGTFLPWQYYQAKFEVSKKWTEVLLPFRDFKASSALLKKTPYPRDLRSIGVVAFGRDHRAEVEVLEVSYF